ncbi:MAG: PhoH family protein [Spartobacteria bacterium]|nr:PhoH family protein [Spartobacteria bacterium]
MTQQTIHFDNAREALDVIGHGKDLVQQVERALGVHLTARDTWLKIAGDAESIRRAEDLIDTLRHARQKGIILTRQGVLFALNAFVQGRESELKKVYATRIEVGKGKPIIFPRTFGQSAYVHSIITSDIAFGIGPAGTGKTYLAMAMAVSTLLKHEVSRIILTRPAIEAGETLGFLPGDMHEKVFPYLRPLYDALYDMMDAEEIERCMKRGVIEVAPLAYMRGRTLNHAFVILDEAQNTTREQMLMFLTRLGFDSKCVITGDLTQVDLPSTKSSGLAEAAHLLRHINEIAISRLDDSDVVRHELVQKVIQAYRNGRNNDAEQSPQEPETPVTQPDLQEG